MKKLLFTAVSALALVGVATAADSTQFGVLTVNSNTKRTLVAVPWVEASTTGSNIAVSNLVLTANLTAGDTLDVLGSTGVSLNRWLLKAGAGGVLYWDSVTMVTEGDNKGSYLSSTPPSNAETIQRGSAVVLIRQKYVYAAGDTIPDGKKAGDAIPFYVMGQVAATAGSTTITAGTASAPCWNMIAPPSTVAQYLNDDGSGRHCADWTKGTAPSVYDRIYVPNSNGPSTELIYTVPEGGNSAVWCVMGDETTEKGGKTIVIGTLYTAYSGYIPLGTGFWYLSKGGSPTVQWDDVPTAN